MEKDERTQAGAQVKDLDAAKAREVVGGFNFVIRENKSTPK